MTHSRTHAFVLVGTLIAALLLAGFSQAAPAHKARSHASQTHAKLTAAQANAVALKKFPGRIAGKTKLENEDGIWQYGVMVQSGKTLREIMVNAKTGKIDSVEKTSSAKERVEAKADAAKAKATVARHSRHPARRSIPDGRRH
jgi:Tfp pilus assembly protein FimT